MKCIHQINGICEKGIKVNCDNCKDFEIPLNSYVTSQAFRCVLEKLK